VINGATNALGATNQVTASIPLSAAAGSIAVAPSTHTAYLSASGTDLPPNSQTMTKLMVIADDRQHLGYFDIFGLAGERAWTHAEGRTWRMSWPRAQLRAVRHGRPWPRSWAATTRWSRVATTSQPSPPAWPSVR
jgi:hypothetical protein